MYFPTKKDVLARLFFYGFLAFILFIYSFGSEPFGLQLIIYNSPLGFIITGALLVLVIWIWFDTKYYLNSGDLIIKFGPFKWVIDINAIKKISHERSPFTAPALSVDRLSILYGNYKVISISPKNKNEFIHLLKTNNPDIIFEDN
ncbi:PH domain-containing protein [Alkalibacillus almallahensis]|uniref:PH domain-containing protein n=1 Tax=Alkalibacillus almallahensis TaxID=1379154 RepID=UPI0014201A3D|nr:PH domain-containing protein [Alkalibacillus almallahensis]NIK11683.1 hypothetical protein [Alkalibacillus almallahensis]